MTLLSADYDIGITGYASPVPGQNIDKLFGVISIAKNNWLVVSKKINAETSDPGEVQLFYTEQVVKLLLSTLKKIMVCTI